MDEHQKGKTDAKLFMPRFVPHQLHTQKAAKAAADGGDGQQHGFPNAAEFILGVIFIHKHKHEAYRIY